MAFDAGSIEATLTLDRDPFTRELDVARQEARDFARETYTASVGLDLTGLRSDIRDTQQQLASLGRDKATPSIDLSTTSFQRQLDTVRTQMDSLARQRVDITVSLSGGAEVLAQLTAIRDLAKEVGELSPTVRVSASGVDETLARLAEVAAAAAAVGDANVNTGTSGGGGGDSGGGALAGLGMPALYAGAVPPGLGAISSALNAIPAAVATAVTAFAALKIGISGVGDALKAANTPAQLAAQTAAFNNLAPAAQQTVLAIRNLAPAFQGLQQSVQGALFTGLADQVGRVNALLPVLQSGLTADAAGLNLVARDILGVVTSSAGMAELNTIFGQTHDVLVALAPAAALFVSNLLDLAAHGSAFLNPLVAGLDQATLAFHNLITQAEQSGQLQAAFANLAGTVNVLLGFFTQLVAAGVQIEAQIGGQVNTTLATLGRVIIAALPGLTSLVGAVLNLATGVGNALVGALTIVTPLLDGIGTAFSVLPGPIGAAVVALTAFSLLSGRMQIALTGMRLEFALLPGVFTAASAAATRFGLAAGAAAVGAGALRTIGSGILTAFGGPWGLVITGAVALLALFGSQSSQSAQQQQQLAQAGAAVADAIAKQNGVIDENVRQTAAKQLSDAGILSLAQQLGINLGTVTDAALGNADAYNKVTSQAQGFVDKMGGAVLVGGQNRDTILSQGHAAQDFQSKLAGVVGGLHDQTSAQNLQTIAVNQAKSAQDLYNDSLSKAVGIVQTSLDAALGLRTAVLAVASAHQSAVTAMQTYKAGSIQVQQAATAEASAAEQAAKAAQAKAIADLGGATASGAQAAGSAAYRAELDKLLPTLSGPAREIITAHTDLLDQAGAATGTLNVLTQHQIDILNALGQTITGPNKAAVNEQLANLANLQHSHEATSQKITDEITQLKLLAGETTGPLHDAALAQIADLQNQAAATAGASTKISDQIGVLKTLAGQLTGPQAAAVKTAVDGLDVLSNAHVTAHDKTVAQIAILQSLADKLNGPARQAILDLISNLKAIPADTPVHVHADGTYTAPQGPGIIHGGVGAYASGGILPGYTPGRDVHTFVSPTGGSLHLSGGEAIMRPEFTAAMGAGYVHAVNHAARTGGVAGVAKLVRGGDGAYADGGVLSIGAGFNTTGYHQAFDTRQKEIELVVAAELALIKAAQAALAAAAAAAGGPGGMSSGAAVELGRSMAAARGWTGAEFDALNKLWTRESGWNPNAVNPSSGAYGIPQALPAAQGHPYALGDAQGQIAWGLNYIAGRYGDPINAWAHETSYGWYDGGGWLPPGLTATLNGTGKPEAVLTAEQWQAVRQALSSGSATERVMALVAKLTQGPGAPTAPAQLPAEIAAKLAAVNEQIASRMEEANAQIVAKLDEVAQILERRGAAATINVHDRSGDPAELARTTMLALRLS